MEQNIQEKKEKIDKEFIDNLLESYSERLARAQEEIERLKHENTIEGKNRNTDGEEITLIENELFATGRT